MFRVHQIEWFSLFNHMRNLEPGIPHGNSNRRVHQTEELVFVSQFYNCRNHAIVLWSSSVWRILIRLCIFTHKNITQFGSVCFFWKVMGVTKIPMPYFSLITSYQISELVWGILFTWFWLVLLFMSQKDIFEWI